MIRKFYITKYALTKGIFEFEGEYGKGNNTMISDIVMGRYSNFYHNNEFHLTLKEAQNMAEAMRLKKISSLEKQIDKLKKLTF